MSKPNKFDGMMHDYCVTHGFCGLSVTDVIPNSGVVSADEFVGWLLKAEAFDGKKELQVLKDVFVKHMGADQIDAKELLSSYRGS